MKSETNGTHTLTVEVTHISKHGFWILLDEKELLLPFKEFPWFKDAKISEIVNVERLMPHHLYWSDLDVDLTVESIEHPEKYPLIAKIDNSQ